jgi:uncharacterized protein (DUF2342 family)
MPIEHFGRGGIVITGDSIQYAQLCAQKGAVGLELKGIKLHRGPVLWKRLRDHYGIQGGKRDVYNWLCTKVEELRPVQEHIQRKETP